ncbi:MAG: HD domain-containing protein [Clostridiales bacterium]|nr:HD domain-containing protein [Clostridiales bacterium]
MIKAELEKYIENILAIRVLSAVSTENIQSAREYSTKLKEDYKKIGQYGIECREIMRNTIYPLINQEELLKVDTLIVLQQFCKMLLEPVTGEELDLSLLFRVSDKLMKDFEQIGDVDRLVKQAHIHVNVCYANVNRTARIISDATTTTYYRDEGLKAARIVIDKVYDKKVFASLSNDAKKSALTVVRFYSALYDTFFFTKKTNIERYDALVNAIKLCDDEFYRDNIENYNWIIHKYRCIEHMGQLTERGNRWGFEKEQCKDICNWLDQLRELWAQDYSLAESILPESHFKLELIRNKYFAGQLGLNEYQQKLLELYELYADDKYDMHSVQMNLLIPAEYLYSLRGQRLSKRIEKRLVEIYNKIVGYILNSANMDAFNYLQEYLIGFLEVFIEIPGVISFEDICLNCLAAIHPPTYVHSLQVADISKCLAEHLFLSHPELFYKDFSINKETAEQNHSAILSYVYHCALCHDFGKLTMIDSIFVYGRNLFDEEFDIIKKHTTMGSRMLSHFPSTQRFAKVARYHHVWYNCAGGYPIEENIANTITKNIVEVADCIDAATDSIGRSYNRGKSFDEIREELMKDDGQRYAPYVIELLSSEEVIDDLKYLLMDGRENNYRNTFVLLTDVKNRAMYV